MIQASSKKGKEIAMKVESSQIQVLLQFLQVYVWCKDSQDS